MLYDLLIYFVKYIVTIKVRLYNVREIADVIDVALKSSGTRP